jgi:hypothetical protein
MQFVVYIISVKRQSLPLHHDDEGQDNKEGCNHLVCFNLERFGTSSQTICTRVFTEEAKRQNQPDSKKKSRMLEHEAVLFD